MKKEIFPKKGTKLYCKKTLSYLDITYFLENKTYTIISKYNNIIKVLSEDVKCNICFSLEIPNNDEFKLYDFFCTNIQQYRKQKLQKLNQTR